MHGKVWGTTARLFCANNVELHRITGKQGGFCSRHHHVGKFNLFYVERGALAVRVWKLNGIVDETTLTPGMTCTVAPGDVHQFEVLEDDTVALELYWVELNAEDIVRQDVGGMRAIAPDRETVAS